MKKRDLFLVVADLDAENAVRTLLVERQLALKIQLNFNPDPPPQGDLLRYAGRDSGCYKDAVDLLRAPQQTHRHAMLIFDHDGSGTEVEDRVLIESEVEEKLQRSGWPKGSVSVIVIDPEIESWVWARSPHVADILGWTQDLAGMRRFLDNNGLWPEGASKPVDPKEAMKAALKKKHKPLGARLFADLASRVSLRNCEDMAFGKFVQVLRGWFPQG